MKISQLTFLGFYLNAAKDSGKYNITIQEVKNHLFDGTLFPFLQDKLKNDIDITVLSEEDKKLLSDEWRDMAEAVSEKRKFGIYNDGLCLLVAYILESIQCL